MFLLARAAYGNSDVVGWVIHCTGDWQDRTKDGRPTKIACHGASEDLWHPLYTGSIIVRTSHKSREWLDIRTAVTGEKHHFDCDMPGECDPPPLPLTKFLPKETTEGPLQAFLESPNNAYARVRLLLSKSESEDTGRITVDHAVIADGARINLQDLIRSTAPSGEYMLEICPFDEKKGCPRDNKRISVKWSRNVSSQWPQPLSAGLYEVVLDKTVNNITLRTADRGLLLIVPRQQATEVSATVKLGETLFLEKWKDQGEGRLMFQALLLELAESH